ncbi:MAG: cation:proton antiporter, partial [Burkholderiales bacterium]
IDQTQYSLLIVAVVASAVVPTLIANAFFLPHHLLGKTPESDAPPAATATAAVTPAPRIK